MSVTQCSPHDRNRVNELRAGENRKQQVTECFSREIAHPPAGAIWVPFESIYIYWKRSVDGGLSVNY